MVQIPFSGRHLESSSQTKAGPLVIIIDFVIVAGVGFKQDACSRDRILGSDALNDHFTMIIMTMEE